MSFSLLALPQWVTTVFPVVQHIFIILMLLGSIMLTVLVLCQQGNSGGGVNALSGTTETYYAQNKGKSKEGRLKRATTIIAICMAVITILYFVSLRIVNG